MKLEFIPVLRSLCGILSIPGCETRAAAFLKKEFGPLFDSFSTDAARNQIFLKKSKKPGTHPLLMLDAHFDEVGMIVSEITDRGFLRVMPVGGLDKKLLPAARVRVYPDLTGSDEDKAEHTAESDAALRLPGVIGYVPPELVLPGEKTPDDWNTFLVDVGTTSKEETEALGIGIGTPVGYADSPEAFAGTRIKGRALDDKACAAALLCAAANIPAESLDYDLALTLSAGEEVGGDGAACAAYTLKPDLAFVADVGFALTPGVDGNDGAAYGSGPVFSLSAVTDRRLTGEFLALAKRRRIPVCSTIDAASTGTNGDEVVYVREGIPAVVAGIPIGGMHSAAESLDTRDADSLIRLLTVFMGGEDPGPIPPEKPEEEKKENAEEAEKKDEPEPEEPAEAEPVPVIPLPADADFPALVRALSEEFGPSGCEGRVAEKIRGFAAQFADETAKDRLGSVIAVYKRRIAPEEYDASREPVSGASPDCTRLMLSAHMDEAGFMVREPDDNGYARPVGLSAKEPMTLGGEDVWIGDETRLTPGYFGVKAVHLGGLGDFGSLYADIGAENKKEASKRVKKGDFGAYRRTVSPLGPASLTGKALSGRPGCAVLLDLLRRLKTENAALPFDVCFVFTARQLIGGSSAGTAANKLSADAAWIFDGLSADDMKKGADGRYGAGCGLGQGAAIPYMDRGTVFDREFTAFLCRSAEKYGIPCQPYRFAAPRSDAGPVNHSGEGVRCALIGWPVRNRTTASEVVRTGDLEAVRELAYRAVTELAAR
jgi:endoglucanase